VRYLAIALALTGCGGGGNATPDAARFPDGKLVVDAAPDAPRDGSVATADADLACPNPGTIPGFAPVRIASGLTQPVYMAQPPGSTDLYVVEKGGRIKIVRGGVIAATFLDVSAKVLIPATDAEGGLLGLAFATDYATSGRFWIYGSFKDGSERAALQEYHHTSGETADAAIVREVLAYPNGGFNSLGGTVRIGPDNMLWLATGDGAAMPSSAPDVTTRAGKMLRIDPVTGQPAPGNLGGGADPYVWDYGLRNPYRFSFDRATGELYLADPGDTMFEEVNIEAPGVGHHDFGWDRAEGTHCVNGSASCNIGTLPQYDRPHAASFSVIIGGSVYRGAAMPCLRGRYIFGIFGTGALLSFVWNGSAITSEVDLSDHLGSVDLTNLTSVVEDQAGELYITTLDGSLYELVLPT